MKFIILIGLFISQVVFFYLTIGYIGDLATSLTDVTAYISNNSTDVLPNDFIITNKLKLKRFSYLIYIVIFVIAVQFRCAQAIEHNLFMKSSPPSNELQIESKRRNSRINLCSNKINGEV